MQVRFGLKINCGRTITPELVTSRKIARAGRISAQYVGIAQLVERRPSKSDVAGSSPVSHSIWGCGGIGRRTGFRFRRQKRVGSTPIIPTIGTLTATLHMESTFN